MSGKNLKFCLVGNNIKNSLSPIIFNYWFRENNLDCSYVLEEIYEQEFASKIEEIFKNYDGLNITAPYKNLITRFLRNLSDEAKEINTVNCVWKGKGFNTDIYGFKKAFLEGKVNFFSKAVILGSGGAAKAVKRALDELNVQNIMLSRKEIENFQKQENHIYINCTTIRSMLAEYITPELYIDINYIGGEREGISFALKMLLYQAQKNFKIWFGFEPKINEELYKLINLR